MPITPLTGIFKKTHEELMTKYYSTEKGQVKLNLQIEQCRREMKELDEKMRALEKYRGMAPCKLYDIEAISDKALACVKVECDYRMKRLSPSILPLLRTRPPHSVKFGDTQLISYTYTET